MDPKDVLLTPEERLAAVDGITGLTAYEAISKAQLRKVVEWIGLNFEIPELFNPGSRTKWQGLREIAGLDEGVGEVTTPVFDSSLPTIDRVLTAITIAGKRYKLVAEEEDDDTPA